MEKSANWLGPFAAVGGLIAAAATLWWYAQAHRSGVPGGYLPMLIGALAAGILMGLRHYFVKPKPMRSALSATALGVVTAVVATAVLTVTLIWVFGS